MKSLTIARRQRKRRLPRVGRQTNDHFDFVGGLNLIDSPLSVVPGQCQGALNYEMGFAGGYQRVGGYRAFDGTPVPSGDYNLLAYGAVTDPLLIAGNGINGGASGASAELLTYTTEGGFGINFMLHNEEIENAFYSAGSLTVADGDEVWEGGETPFLSKMTKDGSVPFINQGGLGAFDIAVDDRLYASFYGRYSSEGGLETVRMFTSGMFSFGVFPTDGGVPNVTFNLKTGTVVSAEFVEDYGMELLSDGVYRCWWISEVAIGNNQGQQYEITLYLPFDPAPDDDYLHLGGLMHVIGPEPVPEGGFGYISTGATTKNVNSGNLVLGDVTSGPFTDDEDLDVLAAVFGQGIGANTTNSETDAGLDAQYSELAADNLSAKPTGSGPVLGVWMHEGTVYAFRDNVGATACDMWESTGGGWSQITLNDVAHFDAGDGAEPAEGDQLDGVGSGADALIKRVVKTSGTWGIDAAGYFVLGTVTNGPFDDDEVLNVTASRVADADGDSAVPVLAPGGRYEFRSYNFYGHSDSHRMYGVDGANYAFEYDKDEGVFTQIETGMTVDTPTHLAAHNGHLFLSFAGGSVQLSGDGVPLSFTVITGASEIGVGDEVSGFNEEVGNSLFIFTRDRTYVLQGNTRANFDMDDFNVNAGAHEWSLQRIGMGCYFDDRGFTTLLQTQRSGSVNFQENAVSELIQPMIVSLVRNTQVTCSHLLRNQNIYRCYFADGRVVSIGFDGHKVSGHMPLEYPFVANVACSEEDTTGGERTFIGAEDGFVYEMEAGTSFAGEPIDYFIRTVLHHSGSPGRMKKYQQVRLDATLSGALTLTGQVEYDFHNDGFNLADELDFSTDEAGGYWDDFAWDAFVWDKPTSGIPQQKLEGEGVNAALYLVGSSASDDIHTLRGATLQWMPRRDDRRN